METSSTTSSAAATTGTPASAESITLKYPFKNAAGQQITTLTVRRPTRKDLKLSQKSGKDPVEVEDLLYSRITSLPIEDLDMLDVEDNRQLSDCFREMQGGDDRYI